MYVGLFSSFPFFFYEFCVELGIFIIANSKIIFFLTNEECS